jgi:hypothetical protein
MVKVEFEGGQYCLLPSNKEEYTDVEDIQMITLLCQCRFTVMFMCIS